MENITTSKADLAMACLLRGHSWPWDIITNGEEVRLASDLDESLYPSLFLLARTNLLLLGKIRRRFLRTIKNGVQLVHRSDVISA